MIVGRLIPAGTGLEYYRNVQLSPELEEAAARVQQEVSGRDRSRRARTGAHAPGRRSRRDGSRVGFTSKIRLHQPEGPRECEVLSFGATRTQFSPRVGAIFRGTTVESLIVARSGFLGQLQSSAFAVDCPTCTFETFKRHTRSQFPSEAQAQRYRIFRFPPATSPSPFLPKCVTKGRSNPRLLYFGLMNIVLTMKINQDNSILSGTQNCLINLYL